MESYYYDPGRFATELHAKISPLDGSGSSTEWTRHLKRAVREIMVSDNVPNRDVIFSDTEADVHEFLLDIVVWDRASGEGITLAVECEWTQHVADIEEDFWKLLVVKCPLKVMIYALNGRAIVHTHEAVWERLNECLKKYKDHRAGERYLFIDFAPGQARRASWSEIEHTGQMKSLPLLNPILMDQL